MVKLCWGFMVLGVWNCLLVSDEWICLFWNWGVGEFFMCEYWVVWFVLMSLGVIFLKGMFLW